MIKHLMLIVLVLFVSGCTHSKKSYFHKNEVVTVKMLTFSDLCTSPALESYNKAFAEKLNCPSTMDTSSAVGAAVVGFGVDQLLRYFSRVAKEEADKYTAEFEGGIFIKNFWNVDGSLKYYGIKVKRTADDDDDQNCSKNAYESYFGIGVDQSNDFLWINPLQFETNCAKPKVSESKAKITSVTQLAFDTVWVDDKGTFRKQNLATITPIVIREYSIQDNDIVRLTNCDHTAKNLKNCFKANEVTSNAIPKIPVSAAFKNLSTNGGYLWLKVVVTETDQSKLKNNYIKISEALEKNRDKIVDSIKKQISSADTKK